MNKIAITLQNLMIQAQIKNYLELSRQSKISELHLYRLENNLLDQIPLGVLKKIARTLNLDLSTLIDRLSDDNLGNNDLLSNKNILDNHLKEEYQRETILILESLLLQFPTLVHAVENNPDISARGLLPFFTPLKQLLSSWEIETIGQVGDIVTYNPQEHELIDSEDDRCDLVEIRYIGYRQRDKLLYRAKVSPVHQ